MKHHSRGTNALLMASMWVGVAACDSTAELDPKPTVEAQGAANVVVENEATLEAEAKATGQAGLEVAIEPASFDLEAVTGVVKKGEIESAAELEVLVNDEAHGYNHLDIDADGKIDHVQVVEIEIDADAEVDADADVVLELRAIPSSNAKVEAGITFATVTFVRHPVDSEVEIRSSFTAVVRQPEAHVYTHVVPVTLDAGVVVSGSVFLSWVYAVERPAYVGVYVVDERGYWIPPGHVKHGHWKAQGHYDEVEVHEVHGHGKAKGDGRIVVDIHGGAGIHFGGSSKGSAKASTHHGGHSSGGKSKSSSGKGGGKSKGGKGKGK